MGDLLPVGYQTLNRICVILQLHWGRGCGLVKYRECFSFLYFHLFFCSCLLNISDICLYKIWRVKWLLWPMVEFETVPLALLYPGQKIVMCNKRINLFIEMRVKLCHKWYNYYCGKEWNWQSEFKSWVKLFIILFNHIYPTPPLGQDMTKGQFLCRVLQVWIQIITSPRLIASPRLKNTVCPTICP